MTDVERRLRDYGKELERRYSVVTVVDLEIRSKLARANTPSLGSGVSGQAPDSAVLLTNSVQRSRRRWWVAAVGVAAAAAVAIAISQVPRNLGDEVIVTEPTAAPETSLASPTTVPETIVPEPTELTIAELERVVALDGSAITFVRGRPESGFAQIGDEVWLWTTDDDSRRTLVSINVLSGQVEEFDFGSAGVIAATADALWADTISETGTVARIDLVSRIVTRVEVDVRSPGNSGPATGDLIAAAGGLWITGGTEGYIRIDLATELTTTYSTVTDGDSAGRWLGEVDGGLWAYTGEAVLTRVDLSTGAVVSFEVSMFGDSVEASIGYGGIWLRSGNGELVKFDVATMAVTNRLRLRGLLGQPAFADGAIWVPNQSRSVVVRIDATTAEVTDTIPVESAPVFGRAFGDSVWFSSLEAEKAIIRIDLVTRSVTQTIAGVTGFLFPVQADDSLWVVAFRDDPEIRRISAR